jgi:lysophospholipase L1-like esterase
MRPRLARGFFLVSLGMKTMLSVLLVMASLTAMTQTPKKKFLALGDSYTIGESVAEDLRWPVQLVAALNAKGHSFSEPEIIATTGWRTDDLKRAIETKKPEKNYDLVSLLIGVNNQYQGRSAKDYAPEFEELLKMAIAFAGGKKDRVFVVSIPDYGFTPFGKDNQQGISKAIDEFNDVNRRIAEKCGVTYVNITDISRNGFSDPSLVATDGLHPSGKMYSQWVEKMIADLKILN